MLTQATVGSYLLQAGLVPAAAVVAGDLMVRDASRRNRNFMILRAAGPSYLLKQGIGPERAATIAHEAAVYRFLHAADVRIGRHLPRLCLYRPEDHVLVLELFPAAQHWGAYHQRRGRFPIGAATTLGCVLSAFHRITRDSVAGQTPALPPCAPPWVLTLHRPELQLYHVISFANLQLIQTLQQFPAFGQYLDALHATWQPDALVHYDLKWENLLMTSAARRDYPRLKVVDWELAGWGDPCWDVGSVFGEYLGFWLRSIPLTGEEPPDRLLDLARYPLVKIQPALRCFWQQYIQEMALPPALVGQWLGRAVRYGAVRLIQTAFEQGQQATQLTSNTLCFLQLAFNMFQRPQEAAVHLLGIPWQGGLSW